MPATAQLVRSMMPGYQLQAIRRLAERDDRGSDGPRSSGKWSRRSVAAVDSGAMCSPLGLARRMFGPTCEGRASTWPRSWWSTGDLGSARAWDFGEDVVPLLTRYGCNTGGCHGRAAGQADFHLSLFGYDAAGDYEAITRRASMRRVDPFQPDAEPALAQGDGQGAHMGGGAV